MYHNGQSNSTAVSGFGIPTFPSIDAARPIVVGASRSYSLHTTQGNSANFCAPVQYLDNVP